MHKLVTVLVDKKDGEFHKDDAIETFYERYVGLEGEHIFDWCEAETAGRWENEFPDNVLTGKDVISRLEEVMKSQKKRENEIADLIGTYVGDGTLVNPECDSFWLGYLLKELGCRKLGELSASCSEFVHLDDFGEGTITPALLEEVKRNTDNYCILLVDAHI